MESTTDVLRERAKAEDSLGQASLFALAGHIVLITVVLFWPSGFWSSPYNEALVPVMTISLGGPAGPSLGGQTALAAKPVQEALPLEEADEIPWEQPPAPAPPKMTVPAPEAPRRPEADIKVESAPDESRGRIPTRGPTLREGNALAETGVEGDGLGLSAGGFGGGGQLDLLGFCCPEYLSTMFERIRRRWNNQQQVSGEVIVQFTIQRDGLITGIERETTSGYLALDQSAVRALRLLERLPPLPARVMEDQLLIRLTFQYQP